MGRGVVLSKRLDNIARRANLVLAELLADAPALHMTIGEDSDWFAGSVAPGLRRDSKATTR